MLLRFVAICAVLCCAAPLFAQPVNLTESPRSGDCARYTLDLNVTGELVVNQENQPLRIKLEARGTHAFTERTLALDAGLPFRSARHYDKATVSANIGGERFEHGLSAERRLVVADRLVDGVACFALAGPITREELDAVAEHFNPQCLAGLLPGKDVNLSDTWSLANPAAQAACQFDGLIKNGLVGKLMEVKDGVATFTIEGPAEGIENGSKVMLAIEARGKFDIAAKRVTELNWKQKDEREQGPVSPASRMDANITLTRSVLAEPPAELTDAALAGIPAGSPTATALLLRHTDAKGRYQFFYPREWHITGQTDSHLILRLLEGGELRAQATITLWKTLPAGQHIAVDDFKRAVASSPGWAANRMLDEGELPVDGGRWIYRSLVEGKLDDLPVVQGSYLLAGPQGEHAVVTFTVKPENLKRLGNRDQDLVKAIIFRK